MPDFDVIYLTCRGWSLGSSEFGKAVSKELEKQPSALRLEREDLADFNRTRWEVYWENCPRCLEKTAGDARTGKRSTDWKLAIGAKLKRERSVTNSWLTERLPMGTARSVSAICGLYMREAERSCPYTKRLNKLTIGH